jgi:hypothetical protein
MNLPINEKELDIIINSLKGKFPSLYAKLWSHKINYSKKETKNGFS